MNILIVGGAGYIGSHVAREFLDTGHAVTVFDNMSSGCPENLFSDAAFVQGDIMDYTGLCSAMRQQHFDGLIHLAAFKAAGESMLKPEKYSINNICGTINLLNAASECGITRMVFSSSAAIYGEPQYVPIDENHPANPENYYGFTKLEIERFLYWYDKLKGMRFAALRYFNAAGYDIKGRLHGRERNPQNLLPIVMEVAAGMRPSMQLFGTDYPTRDGTCIRDYVHVSDLALGHVAAFEYLVKNDRSITVNLGSETGISVTEMVETARRLTGRPIPVVNSPRRPGDSASLTSSAALARELLGWQARYSDVETLISSTWKVYKGN